jgi:hypothetical protein
VAEKACRDLAEMMKFGLKNEKKAQSIRDYTRAGILEKSMGARNRVGIGLS